MFCNKWLRARSKNQALYMCIQKVNKTWQLKSVFWKVHISWKQPKVQTSFFTEFSSISRNVTPRESNFGKFAPEGKQGQSEKKLKHVLHYSVHCCQCGSNMLQFKKRNIKERDHENKCLEEFLLTNTVSPAASPSRDTGTWTDALNLSTEREGLTVKSADLSSCVHSYLPLSRWGAPEGGTSL